MRYFTFLLFIGLGLSTSLYSQPNRSYFSHVKFSKYDTLRGSLNKYRTCYDVTFYDLQLKVKIADRSITGSNTIHYTTTDTFQTIQVDLFANMKVDSIIFKGKTLHYERDSHFMFIHFPQRQPAGQQQSLKIYYHGQPVIADNPPWDGGFVWKEDKKGRPWVGVACEMIGASLWWPCKDHLTEEPDSAAISLTVPDTLKAVANGVLRKKQPVKAGWQRYEWFVHNPINTYNITLNIADYAHFSDIYTHQGDTLPLDYYVLRSNKEKAKKHFHQVPDVLRCFEHYFGAYPFWEDGYKLVETPYLGMEHQSAIAYGNHYKNNLEPRNLIGMEGDLNLNYDYVIVHETGHEWWGNSLSAPDFAQLWLHEAFTTYAEALFVEYTYSYNTAVKYLKQQRTLIANDEPIVGVPGVNFYHWGYINDLYYKGSWILHTLRHVVNNDSLWFDILHEFAGQHKHSIVSTEQFIEFVNQKTGRQLDYFFEQYLYHPNRPVLEYSGENTDNGVSFKYRWRTDVADFDMPLTLNLPHDTIRIHPTTDWRKQHIDGVKRGQVHIATESFYIKTDKVNKSDNAWRQLFKK